MGWQRCRGVQWRRPPGAERTAIEIRNRPRSPAPSGGRSRDWGGSRSAGWSPRSTMSTSGKIDWRDGGITGRLECSRLRLPAISSGDQVTRPALVNFGPRYGTCTFRWSATLTPADVGRGGRHRSGAGRARQMGTARPRRASSGGRPLPAVRARRTAPKCNASRQSVPRTATPSRLDDANFQR